MERSVRLGSLIWFATGAAAMLLATVIVLQAWGVDAAPGDSDATLVATTPCRLADTRSDAQFNVGPKSSPFGPGETATIDARGDEGECPATSLPDDAVALALNVTALNASQNSFVTIWSDGDRPNSSSLNPTPGQPPTPNAVIAELSASGSFDVYNENGTVDIVIDVVGHYTASSLHELNDRLLAAEAAIQQLDEREAFAATSEFDGATMLTSTPTDMVSLEVTAPVAGQVTVTSHAGVRHDGADGDDVVCKIFESNEPVGPLTQVNIAHIQWFETHDPANDTTLNGTRVFDVPAGTHTFDLTCMELGDGGWVWDRSLSAIFTPAR